MNGALPCLTSKRGLINADYFGIERQANDDWINAVTGRVYMVYGEIDTTNSLPQLSPELEFEFFYKRDYADGPGFNNDFTQEIRSIVIDLGNDRVQRFEPEGYFAAIGKMHLKLV